MSFRGRFEAERRCAMGARDGRCDYPNCPKAIDFHFHDKPPPGWAIVTMRRYTRKGSVVDTKLVCSQHTMDFAHKQTQLSGLGRQSGWRRVIIESPYRGSTPEESERNLRYLRAAMRECLLQGEAPYASHALYTQPGVLDDNKPEERQLGIFAGLEWGDAAEKTIVYQDLGNSDGMIVGIKKAEEVKRPVISRSLKGWIP